MTSPPYTERCPTCGQRVLRHEDHVTTRDAAALLGVSQATIRNWCNAGKLAYSLTIGGHRRIARSTLAELREQMREGAS